MTARRHSLGDAATPTSTEVVNKFAGRHNRRRDGSLKPAVAQAVEIARAAAPHLSDLADRIIPVLPYQMLASDTVKTVRAESHVEPVLYAVERRRIGLNSDTHINAVVVDIDHDDLDLWRERGFPAPTWIAMTPDTGRHHIVWLLASPVYRGESARQKPLRFLRRVVEAVTAELDGDPSYTGGLTKNPFHPAWRTIIPTGGGQPVELRDLHAPVALAETSGTVRHRRPLTKDDAGRNVDLFHGLRFWAYDAKPHFSDRRAWDIACAAKGAEINQTFAAHRKGVLKSAEVAQVVHSVARWVWTRYIPRQINRGVMDLSPELPLAERQRLAALRSAERNRSGSDAAIGEAIAALGSTGQPVTQAAVVAAATAAGHPISLSTVKRRWTALTKTVPAPKAETKPILAIIEGGKFSVRSTAASRAAEYERIRLARDIAEIRESRAAQGAAGPRPLPAFLSVRRLRTG